AGGSFRGSIARSNGGSGGNCSGSAAADAVCTAPPGLTISVFTGTGRIGSVEPAAGRGAGMTAVAAGSERASVVLALASAKLDPTLGAGFGSAILGSRIL